MKKHRATKVILAAGIMFAGAAISRAASGDVQFNGAISTACTINVTQNGTFGQSANAKRIAGGQPGGQMGTALVTTTGYGYVLSAAAPSAFLIQPAADVASPETFFAYIRGAAGTTFAWTESAQNLNLGASTIRVNLAAQKPAGPVSFANGNYSAVVVLTCE